MSKNLFNFFIIFFIIIISSYKIFLPTFNLEWFFLDLANFFNQQNKIINLAIFKEFQANTSFYSLIISNLKLENFITQVYFVRILNLITLPFLIFSINYILQYFSQNFFYQKIDNSFLILIYIIFSPIIFLLIGKSFPDYFSFFFVIVAYYFFLKESFFYFLLFFILASITKPLILYIIPLFWIVSFYKKNIIFDKQLFLVIIISIFFMILYIYKIDSFLFSNEHENYNLQNNKLLRFFSNYLIYISYLSVLLVVIIPHVLLIFLKKKNNYKLLVFFFSLILIFFIEKDYGEMNYGFISSFIKGTFVNYLIIFIAVLFYIIFSIDIFLNKKENYKIFFLGINLSLIVLSIFVERPAQRYLIYIYPFFLIFIYFFYNNKLFKFIFSLNMVIFLLINFFQFIYQKNFSNVAENIYNDLKQKNLINITNPLDIYHINGYKFNKDIIFRKNKKYEYIVLYCDINKAVNKIKAYDVKLMGLVIKELCIIRIDDNH